MNTLTQSRQVSLPVTPNQKAEAMTGRPHVSYSEIRTFQNCPLKWHFQYVQKARPEQLASAMLLGTCVHAAIQQILEAMIASESWPSIDQVMETYRQTWTREAGDLPLQYPKGMDADACEATARRMLEAFVSSDVLLLSGEIIGIEESFEICLADDLPDLAGRVDMISRDRSVVTITDFKTARSIPTDEAAEEMAEQLVLYAQGCRPIAEGLEAKISLRYVYLTKTKEPKVEIINVNLDPTRTKKTKAIVRNVFKAMQTGVVYPAPSPINCSGCGFKKRCMKWQDQEAMA